MRKLFPVLATATLLGGCVFSGGAVTAAPQASPVPAKFPAPPTYSLGAAMPEAASPWSFYLVAAGETNIANYTEVTPGVDAAGNVMLSSTSPQVSMPHMYWSANDPAGVVTIRPESDRNAPGGKGDIIAMWTVPAKDLYLLNIEIDNIGLDVKGGDGGMLTVSQLKAGETLDTRVLSRIGVPLSSAVWPHAHEYPLIDADAGDRIVLRINAGADGYADQWKLRYSIARTGPEGFLAQPPVVAEAPGAPLRPGLFWLGTDSNWAASPYAKETLDVIRHYVPDLGMVMVSHYPERTIPPAYYRENNIPTLAQSWGPTYAPFFQIKNAFERTWKGEDLGQPGLPLAGTAHAKSMPHTATREAFERVVRSSRRSGYSGFGIQDMVWVWGGGRGASGYSPATVAAFQKDLQGLDEGLRITPVSGGPRLVKFADYAGHYLGGMPSPAAFGFKSWAQYQPITFEEYSKKLKQDYTPDFLLFDMLVHYEWLKLADFMGKTAQSENGLFQLMGNPEDVANGNDLLFASQLDSVSMVSEEYFETPLFLDGAYYHFPYYARGRKSHSSVGVVMESGGGGNGIPYYATEVAYASALELTLATEADHLEGDFWTSNWGPLKDMLTNPLLVERYRQTLAMALGFNDARRDHLRRVEPDFISVTPRRIFRPYDTGWYPWAWRLKFPLSPEPALAENGFNFEGVAEDGLDALKLPQKAVLYSTSLPTELGWNRFSKLVSEGRIRRGILVAGGLQQFIDKSFVTRPFAASYPLLNFGKASQTLAGALAVNGAVIRRDMAKVVGETYADKTHGTKVVMALGGQPLVVQRAWGKGILNVLLFDPSEPGNSALTTAVYGALLGQEKIGPRWQSDNGTVARLYQSGALVVVGLQHPRVRTVRSELTLPQGDVLEPRTWPYKIEGALNIKLKLSPDQSYDWVALPSGQRGQVTANKKGYAPLRHEGTTQEVFYLLPSSVSNAARLDQIQARKHTFDEAMTIGGRIAADATQLTP